MSKRVPYQKQAIDNSNWDTLFGLIRQVRSIRKDISIMVAYSSTLDSVTVVIGGDTEVLPCSGKDFRNSQWKNLRNRLRELVG